MLFVRFRVWAVTNPLYTFIMVAGIITVVFGVIAFLPKGTPSEDTALATAEETDPGLGDQAAAASEEDAVFDKESEALPEEDEEPTVRPTRKPSATPTQSVSPTPSATPEPTGRPTYSINYLGDIFVDANCNGTYDSDTEGTYTAGTMTVNFFEMPDSKAYGSDETDSAGHYSLSRDIQKDSLIKLGVEPVIPAGYKGYPKFASETKEFFGRFSDRPDWYSDRT